MRMSSYYLSLLVLTLASIGVTVFSGLTLAPWHLKVALPTAALVVGLHSLVILFSLIGSRLLREGINNCGLSPELLVSSNRYFRRVSGLFLSLAGAFSIVGAGVLGYGRHAFGLSPNVHLILGLSAALITLVAIPLEWRYLRSTERLLDTAREVLDENDRRRAERGIEPVDEQHEPQRDTLAQTGRFITVAPWLIYLYQVLIVWRGRLDQTSLHPWVEISVVGLVIWIRGARASRDTTRGDQDPQSEIESS